MGCTRNRSKIWGDLAVLIAFNSLLLFPSQIWAAIASQFSLSVGEEYSDNIFFRKNKESDFITIITPTLSLYYAPTGQGAPTSRLNISPSGYIYAHHSDLNSFGFTNNGTIDGSYVYQYSPRLTFSVADAATRQGQTRLGIGNGANQGFQAPQTPTAPISPLTPQLPSQNLQNFVSGGDQLTNNFSFQGNFLFRPDVSFNGGYTNTYTKFISRGGSDISHTFGVRGVYNWKQEHNLHAGYSVSINNSRNGDNGFIHNFDFGDDYFTSQIYNIQITPTLSLSASTGLSINTSNSGPRVGNNSTITVTKLWETASFAAGLRKGLTPSFGISGVSDTTDLFSTFRIQMAERLTGNAGTDFAFYDTKDVNFKTFQASAGLQYQFTTWLSSSLSYSYQIIDSGAGASSTDLLTRGKVSSSSVFLTFASHFDLWPNFGLARSVPFSNLSPSLRTPFPSANPGTSTTPSTSSSPSIK